jgi:hypothetical protein
MGTVIAVLPLGTSRTKMAAGRRSLSVALSGATTQVAGRDMVVSNAITTIYWVVENKTLLVVDIRRLFAVP